MKKQELLVDEEQDGETMFNRIILVLELISRGLPYTDSFAMRKAKQMGFLDDKEKLTSIGIDLLK